MPGHGVDRSGAASGTGGADTAVPNVIEAKGDLIAGTGTGAVDNLAAGANDTFLVPDSSLAKGLKWVTGIAARLLLGFPAVAAKGDLFVGSAADTIAKKAVGSDGYSLVPSSAATDGMAWIRQAGFILRGGYLDWTVSGNVLTVAIKTDDGGDPSDNEPVFIDFRDPTASTGSLVTRKIVAANSIAINDTALLGTINSTAFRLWCVAFDDGGTVRLALINCLLTATTVPNIYPLAGFGIASATQEVDGADSAHVFYSHGAAVTSKAFSVLGYATWETGLATAGTWSAGPTRKQLFGLGVPLPGQQIRRVVDIDSTERTTTSDTFVTTELALTFTPDSAANLIELSATTPVKGVSTDNVPGMIGEFQIARGSATGTSLAKSELMGGHSGAASTGWGLAYSLHILTHDYNQSAATTYTVAMRDGGTGTIRAQNNSGVGILIAKEIMT